MDIDPLGDAPPARHMIESDDEDELNPLPRENQEAAQPEPLQVKLIGTIPKDRKKLVVATGKAGKVWAKGADLGEQIGAVATNNVQMGQVFTPEWTSAVVLISEVLSRLPTWAMHPYVKVVVDELNPDKTFLLDIYAVSTYTTSTRAPDQDDNAPMRYLSTSTTPVDPSQYSPAEPFAPPNLVQGTAAAFVSHLTFRQHDHPNSMGFLLLLPYPTVPPPPPPKIPPVQADVLQENDDQWSTETMNDVQKLLAKILEEKVHEWQGTSIRNATSGIVPPTGRKRELGNESLYT